MGDGMMVPVTASDLDGLPGGPFTDQTIAQAVDAIRAMAGWHIGPAVEETIVLDGGLPILHLPSLHVTSVSAVVDVSDPGRPRGIDPGQYRWFTDGRIHHRTGVFPTDVEVVFTNGYEVFPPDLHGVVASLAGVVQRGGRITSEALSGHSVSIDSAAGRAVIDPVIAKYMLPSMGGGLVAC